MSKNLSSPTKLTEFAPLQPEEKQSTVGQFISKLFKFNKNSNNDETVTATVTTTKTTTTSDQENLPNWAIDTTTATTTDNNDGDTKPTTLVYPVDMNEGRSLPNVLKRISNLLALKNNNLQDYADTELKQYWMPDSVSKECYECSEKFTTFRRKHHCRVCGQIFCSQCCNQQIPGKIFGCTGDLRCCTYCCKVVLSYLQSSSSSDDLINDLRLLQENLQSRSTILTMTTPPPTTMPTITNTTNTTTITSTTDTDNRISSLQDNTLRFNKILKRKISVGYQEEKFAVGQSNIYLSTEEKYKALQNSSSLRGLFEEMTRPINGITLSTHRYRLRTYSDCFLGSELVDWLIYQQKANNRVQAVAICQALLEGGYIECVSDPCSFVDGNALYKLGQLLEINDNSDVLPLNQDEPTWIQQVPQESTDSEGERDQQQQQQQQQRGQLNSSSSYTLDLNIEANSVYLSKPAVSLDEISTTTTTSPIDNDDVVPTTTTTVKTSKQRELVPESGWHNANNLREDNGEKLAYDLLTEAYEQHVENLLKQLLIMNGLSLTWMDVILKLCCEIIDLVRPDKNHDAEDLDIRHYIKFKKLPGGNKTDTRLINGIVFTKNIAHKRMRNNIKDAKLLLLNCSIVYQRTEGRLMSLEPIMMQEQEYLKHIAARITILQPDIVLVHKNVTRLAQDLLRENNITLIHNIKQNILEQISRCTNGDLIQALDAHIGKPRLGKCEHFYIKTFNINDNDSDDNNYKKNIKQKTLMFIERPSIQHLAGTILLRGGNRNELKSIEKVVKFLTFAVYNWRLEKSFLMDEFAQPPQYKYEFLLDDNTENNKNNNHNICNESSTINVQKIKQNRKLTSETVDDFTDPLQNDSTTLNKINDEVLSVTELPLSTNTFRKLLDDTILCISPYIHFSIPYLETESGKKCKLRQFFPNEIYYSEQFTSDCCRNQRKINRITSNNSNNNNVEKISEIKPLHPFLTAKITSMNTTDEIQALLADFRARGGRYDKRTILITPTDTDRNDIDERYGIKFKNYYNPQDCLEINNHQRLAVLFCSYSLESSNAPQFCVNPWIVNMNFYNTNDIPLGCFLERYCFRTTYECPSKTCNTTMLKHTRRFVHNAGCVSIQLNHFNNEFQPNNQIVMWTWCRQCQHTSPMVQMSSDTWSFSFAKYLELKFYGNLYTRRGISSCEHSLHHDHYQYFGYKNLVASFQYNPIQVWEISLPPSIIEINYDLDKLQNQLIDEIRIMSQKGHEIFSIILEKLSTYGNLIELDGLGNLKQLLLKEQQQFKQKIEEIQLKLTSPTIEQKQFEQNCANYWTIFDSLIRIKRTIIETIDNWNLRLSEISRNDKQRQQQQQQQQQQQRSSVSDLENSNNDNNDVDDHHHRDGDGDVNCEKLEDSTSSPKSYRKSQSSFDSSVDVVEQQIEIRKDDKKSVKTILSQFLPSSTTLSSIINPFNIHEHYTLPTGVLMPIVVYELEPSSIIAYALNSFDYKRSFDEMTTIGKKSNNCDNSPINKRRNLNETRNESIDDKSSSLLGFLRNKDTTIVTSTTPTTTTNITPSSSSSSSLNLNTSPEINQLETDGKNEDLKKSKKQHIEVQFQDSNCNFFCRIYFAEKFAILRQSVLPIGEEAYIRSLSRSNQWNARGGKSGSNFAKTADDRFILKEMTKSEVQLFLESAPNYFIYLQRCLQTGQPTLLGKIAGVYQIIFKNNTNASTLRTNLLVMENLFYKRTVSQKFDLKGSMRNRLVIPDNQEGEIVLLDENLLKMTCEAPLYILPHSKAVLTAAIQNDTEFLSAQSVMDYSLLVGLDAENRELVLGIIDYIRTFTWDKKLETMVKKSGILGGQGKTPTIVSPEEYQKRFIEAMHRYFLEIPDHWAGLGKGLEF